MRPFVGALSFSVRASTPLVTKNKGLAELPHYECMLPGGRYHSGTFHPYYSYITKMYLCELSKFHRFGIRRICCSKVSYPSAGVRYGHCKYTHYSGFCKILFAGGGHIGLISGIIHRLSLRKRDRKGRPPRSFLSK